MLIIISVISFYLAGILFYIQSKPSTQKITESLFWPIYLVKNLFQKRKCPLCQNNSFKVIYYGLPVYFCKNENCNCMFGFWHFVTDYLPFNGILFVYEGSYLIALCKWLREK